MNVWIHECITVYTDCQTFLRVGPWKKLSILIITVNGEPSSLTRKFHLHYDANWYKPDKFLNGSQHKPAIMWPLFSSWSTVALKCEFQQTQTNSKATILFTFHCENDQRHADKKCYHTFEKHIAKTRQTRLRYERKDAWLWSWNPLVLRTDWTDWKTETSVESNIKHIHSATQCSSAWTKSFPRPLKLVTCGKPSCVPHLHGRV